MVWQVPELNLLVSTDKNALQDIFLSLQRKIGALEVSIDKLTAIVEKKEKR